MSIVTTNRIIQEGDPAILYENAENLTPIKLKAGTSFQNRFGNFFHSDIIGKPFGSKIQSRGAKGGYIYVLRPTPELWTKALLHRTQILYHADISLVCMWLRLRPGAVVVESGTGSGSLSTSMARCIAPHGHLHTFEFNADRVDKARQDFVNNGIDHLITVRHRDVCAKGFPLIGGGADAVFLDLPRPWEVVASCHALLRPQAMFCSFSPCMEQVQRTCLALEELKFTDIRTVEVLQRTFENVEVTYTKPNFGPAITEVTAPSSVASSSDDDAASRKRQREEEAGTPEVKADASEDSDASGLKKQRTTDPSPSPAAAAAPVPKGRGRNKKPPVEQLPKKWLARPYGTMRGHTGYLTFAMKPPTWDASSSSSSSTS